MLNIVSPILWNGTSCDAIVIWQLHTTKSCCFHPCPPLLLLLLLLLHVWLLLLQNFDGCLRIHDKSHDANVIRSFESIHLNMVSFYKLYVYTSTSICVHLSVSRVLYLVFCIICHCGRILTTFTRLLQMLNVYKETKRKTKRERESEPSQAQPKQVKPNCELYWASVRFCSQQPGQRSKIKLKKCHTQHTLIYLNSCI